MRQWLHNRYTAVCCYCLSLWVSYKKNLPFFPPVILQNCQISEIIWGSDFRVIQTLHAKCVGGYDIGIYFFLCYEKQNHVAMFLMKRKIHWWSKIKIWNQVYSKYQSFECLREKKTQTFTDNKLPCAASNSLCACEQQQGWGVLSMEAYRLQSFFHAFFFF